MKRKTLASAALLAFLLTGPAFAADEPKAPEWEGLPEACLPDRATPWEEGKSEEEQAACHCPPPEMCPQSIDEWSANEGLPPELRATCCKPPVCPAGSVLAGQPVPKDENCNPTCPIADRVFLLPATQAGNIFGSGFSFGDYTGKTIVRSYSCACPVNYFKVYYGIYLGNTSENPEGYFSRGGIDDNVARDIIGKLFAAAHAGKLINPDGSAIPASELSAHNDKFTKQTSAGHNYGKYYICSETPVGDCTETGGDITGRWMGHISGSDKPQKYCWTDSCVKSDSLVLMDDGRSVAAGELAVGDRLKSTDGYAEIIRINAHERLDRMYYKINDLKFAITGDHPLQTTEGWKIINPEDGSPRLEIGDELVGVDGKTVTVAKIEPKVHNELTQSVNIGTAGDRPFFVDGIAIKPFKDVEFKY